MVRFALIGAAGLPQIQMAMENSVGFRTRSRPGWTITRICLSSTPRFQLKRKTCNWLPFPGSLRTMPVMNPCAYMHDIPTNQRTESWFSVQPSAALPRAELCDNVRHYAAVVPCRLQVFQKLVVFMAGPTTIETSGGTRR